MLRVGTAIAEPTGVPGGHEGNTAGVPTSSLLIGVEVAKQSAG